MVFQGKAPLLLKWLVDALLHYNPFYRSSERKKKNLVLYYLLLVSKLVLLSVDFNLSLFGISYMEYAFMEFYFQGS